MNFKKFLLGAFAAKSALSQDAQKPEAADNFFGHHNLLLNPAINKRSVPVEQPEFSQHKCQEILTRNNNFQIYSDEQECSQMDTFIQNGSSASHVLDDGADILAQKEIKKHYTIAPKTLDELARSAHDYWCDGMGEESFDCNFSTTKDSEEKPSNSILVCGTVNTNHLASGAYIGEVSQITNEEMLYPIKVNGLNDDHRNIKISLGHVDDLERSDDGYNFEIHKPTSKTKIKDSVDTTFIHEIGHTALHLAHPDYPKVDSIMQAYAWADKITKKRINTDTTKNMAPQDKNFMAKCVGKKTEDREL